MVVEVVLREVEEARALHGYPLDALLFYCVRAEFHRRRLAARVAHLVEHCVQFEGFGRSSRRGKASAAEVVVYRSDKSAFRAALVKHFAEHPSDARLAVRARNGENFERVVGVGVEAFCARGGSFGDVGNPYPSRGEALRGGLFRNDCHRPPVRRLFDVHIAVGVKPPFREKCCIGGDAPAVGYEHFDFGLFVARNRNCVDGFRQIRRRVGGKTAVLLRERERAEAAFRAAKCYETV